MRKGCINDYIDAFGAVCWAKKKKKKKKGGLQQPPSEYKVKEVSLFQVSNAPNCICFESWFKTAYSYV